MIIITLGLLSAISKNLSRLGHVQISNTATNKRHPKYGNYKAEFYTKTKKLKRTVYVEDYARERDSVFELLSLVMIEYKRAEKEERVNRKIQKKQIQDSEGRREELPNQV